MRPIHKVLGITLVVLHRMWYHLGLTLLALFGVVLAVGLVTSASFFAQAVDTVMLRREMTEYTQATGRPPFFSRVFASSSILVPLSLERVEVLNAQLADTFSREIGLPLKQVTFQANSGNLELRDLDDEYGHDAEDINIIYADQIAGHMTIVEGVAMGDGASNERLDLWMHGNLADATGMQVGEQYNVAPSDSLTVVPAQIAGIWRPIDADDPYLDERSRPIAGRQTACAARRLHQPSSATAEPQGSLRNLAGRSGRKRGCPGRGTRLR